MKTLHPLDLPPVAVYLERVTAYASGQIRDGSAAYICGYIRADGRIIYGSGASTWQAIVDATTCANAGEARDEANRVADLCHFPLWRFEGAGETLCQVWPVTDDIGAPVAFLVKR